MATLLDHTKNALRKASRWGMNLADIPAIVLLYHRVARVGIDPQMLSVDPENFSKQVAYLKKNYDLLTIDEFQDSLEHKRKFPRKAVILTFDDGYADNYHCALPILAAHDAQAIFYVATAHIGSQREFYWDDLERIFLIGRTTPKHLKLVIAGQVLEFDTSMEGPNYNVYNVLQGLMRNCNSDNREDILEQLYRWSGVAIEGRETHRILSRGEVEKLSQSRHAVIGAHTHNHVRLASLFYQEQWVEIERSKHILEEILSKKIDHFSYPFGLKHDFNTHSVDIVRKIGFKMVCANVYGQVHHWTDIMRIPRVIVRNWDFDTFRHHIAGYFRC